VKYVYAVWFQHPETYGVELKRIFSTEKSAREWLDNYVGVDIVEYHWIGEIEIDKV
jgi:hypothetical protein